MIKNKKILIFLVIAIGIAVYYFWLRPAPSPEEAALSLSSSDDSASLELVADSQDIASSEEFFLRQITQLERISFSNATFLQNPSFSALRDNTVPINVSQQRQGRTNPFAPISASSSIILPPVEAEEELQSPDPDIFIIPEDELPGDTEIPQDPISPDEFPFFVDEE